MPPKKRAQAKAQPTLVAFVNNSTADLDPVTRQKQLEK